MISAPHAVGKSTTAQKLADRYGFLFVSSFAGKIAKEMDYDLNKERTPEQILEYQHRLLKAFQMHYEATDDVDTVYDRSPLDFAVYTVMEIRKHDHDGRYVKRVAAYVKECIETTDGYCDFLIIPEANLEEPYEDKDNRPSFSTEQIVYRKTYSLILDFYVTDLTLTKVVRVPIDKQYDERVQFINEAINGSV